MAECLNRVNEVSSAINVLLKLLTIKYNIMNELVLWVLCSVLQTIICSILLWAEDDEENFKAIFTLLLIGLTPMSMFIVIGAGLVLIIAGTIVLFEYIGSKLFDKLKS